MGVFNCTVILRGRYTDDLETSPEATETSFANLTIHAVKEMTC